MSDEHTENTAPVGAPGTSTHRTTQPGGTVTMAANEGVPPAGEDIHLPPGTIIPFMLTLGITLTLVGTTVNWLWTILGGIIFVICLVLWVRDTITEVNHLPDEHGSPSHH